MAKEKILIVDDEPIIRWTLREAIRGWGYDVLEASTLIEALTLFETNPPAIVLLDIFLPDGFGIDALRTMKTSCPQSIVIMITANVLIEDTIAALRSGAYDFIGKPINLDELKVTIRNAIETRKLRKEITQLRQEKTGKFNFAQIVGESAPMKEMITLAQKVSQSEAASVLLLGESGTGKDLVAKAIHYSSRRLDHPFMAINCAAIPATLIESELFGYEKGAFTDAKARKEGLFEQAEGGTLFLDEIGELELGLQAKLLHVLEGGKFRRVGGLKEIPLDIRVIAASNRDLKIESSNGNFRLDLYYRLSVIQIDLPPLRERGYDVLLLTKFYIDHYNQRLRKQIQGLSLESENIFRNYKWPGNVRELRNVIERAMILEDGEIITPAWLPRGITQFTTHNPDNSLISPSDDIVTDIFLLPKHGIELNSLELNLVKQAMKRTGGNQTKAADLLGISRDQLRYRLKKLEKTS